jgi:NADPH:quinone reductase-like Zn-dependent oxidoreductase
LAKASAAHSALYAQILCNERGIRATLLVKVLAASVQFTAILLRKGRYPDFKVKPPLVLGYDVVGKVVKVGPGVTQVSVGQRVADLTVTGSYAQYRTLQADRVTAVDPTLDAAEVTSLVLSWTTAYQLLHRDARIQKGQNLLVIGAAGAVGQALVVLGVHAGCKVWGAAHPRHANVVGALGAIHGKKHPDWFMADLSVLIGMLAHGDIKPRVAERIALDAVADAHTRLERGGLEGKVVLMPNR